MPMQLPANSFKAALGQSSAQIGLWLALASEASAEVCATAGFDWLLVDAEHAPNDLTTIQRQLQAMAAYTTAPVVRVPANDPVIIKRVLELGVESIMIPMIDSAEAAQQAARAMRYPPEGMRGVGSGLARSSRWGGYPDYLARANAEVFCIVQLESVAGLASLESIAAVDGVDALFIGAADLAADMGYLGKAGHPEVKAAVDQALARARSVGKPCGFLATEPTEARRLLAAGASFVAVGADSTLLAKVARGLAQDFGCGGG